MKNKMLARIRGATMIEYVLIVGLIAVASIVIITTLGTNITASFTKVSNAIPK